MCLLSPPNGKVNIKEDKVFTFDIKEGQNSPDSSLFDIKEDKKSSFDIEEGQNSPGSSMFDIGEDKNSLFDIKEDKKSWTITVQIVIEQSFALEAALSVNSLDKTLNFMLNTLPRKKK